MKPTFKCVYRPYGRIYIQDSIEEFMKLLLLAAIAMLARAAMCARRRVLPGKGARTAPGPRPERGAIAAGWPV